MTGGWLSVIAPILVSNGETTMWSSIYIMYGMYAVMMLPVVAVVLEAYGRLMSGGSATKVACLFFIQ